MSLVSHYTNVLITGNSSGIGLALTQALLGKGSVVYGLSRRGCPISHENLHDIRCDLGDLSSISHAMSALLEELKKLDLVVLNAGILGEIRSMPETPVSDIEDLMRINVWSNKVLLDWLITESIDCAQIVMISSGAAVNGNKGWSGYSLSKATLNMLTQLYAHEMPETHLSALAPGLVDTAMQDYLCDPAQADAENFPSLSRLREARGTEVMPTPDAAAQKLLTAFPQLLLEVSGSFRDIRTMD